MNDESRSPWFSRPVLAALTLVAVVLLGMAYSGHVHAGMGMGGGMMSGGGMNGMMQPGGGSSGSGSTGASAETEGGKVYTSTCAMCHATGLAGAPRFGDQAAWAPRIEQGRDVLYDHALHGFRAMPAKGGHMELSDDQVRAAVDYMINGASSRKPD